MVASKSSHAGVGRKLTERAHGIIKNRGMSRFLVPPKMLLATPATCTPLSWTCRQTTRYAEKRDWITPSFTRTTVIFCASEHRGAALPQWQFVADRGVAPAANGRPTLAGAGPGDLWWM